MNMLYNAADVFVLPSAGEGCGIPLMEAQAAT
jgi:glycogen synthase